MTPDASTANDWNAVVIHPADTVAVALAPLTPGPTRVRRGDDVLVATVLQPIPMGHKFAMVDMAADALVVKYGEPIGSATAAIPAGAHVHVHNLRSRRARGGGRPGAAAG
jgi:altronate dehydratase